MLLFRRKNKVPRIGRREEINAVLLTLLYVYNSPRELLNAVFDSVDLGWNLRSLTSNKLPDSVDADGVSATLQISRRGRGL